MSIWQVCQCYCLMFLGLHLLLIKYAYQKNLCFSKSVVKHHQTCTSLDLVIGCVFMFLKWIQRLSWLLWRCIRTSWKISDATFHCKGYSFKIADVKLRCVFHMSTKIITLNVDSPTNKIGYTCEPILKRCCIVKLARQMFVYITPL